MELSTFAHMLTRPGRTLFMRFHFTGFILLFLLFILCSGQAVFAQPGSKPAEKTTLTSNQPTGKPTVIHVEQAGTLSSITINGKKAQKLKDNVVISHEDIVMYCDSAYLFDESNTMNAFGHVHINQHDSMHLYGETLDYDGNKKYAIVRRNVRLNDNSMNLNTDRLDYDRTKGVAFYTNGATITDKENTLTSEKGYYYSASRDLFFRGKVLLTNPKYNIKADTLQYNTTSKKAFFHGPTYINSKKDTIYCETGWYHTTQNLAYFGKNAWLVSGGQKLFGDSLIYDRNKEYGEALGHVQMIDSAEKLTFHGNYGQHFEKTNKTVVTGDVIISKEFNKDTLHMTADTIRSTYDSSGKYRILRGYRHVRMFSREFQARCDSLIYSMKDSIIDMRQDPVFWFGKYQTTAEHILIYTHKNQIQRADLFQKSFVATPEDSQHFSQIKGRDMVAWFRESQLRAIDVKGNGESVYYVKDDSNAYLGVNKIVSSDIKVSVKDQKVQRINFIKDPDSKLTPISQADVNELKLPGFKWREKERPKSLEELVVHYPKPPKNDKPKGKIDLPDKKKAKKPEKPKAKTK